MSGDERCVHCGHPVRVINYALGPEVMHIQPEASFPTTQKGTAWRQCRRSSVATLPPQPVDGTTDPCPAPGYAGRHTAVGAGAVSPPYRCHGCGTWFTLPDPTRPTPEGDPR
jgi:hypothetical protein